MPEKHPEKYDSHIGGWAARETTMPEKHPEKYDSLIGGWALVQTGIRRHSFAIHGYSQNKAS